MTPAMRNGIPSWTVYPCQPVYLTERYTPANRYTFLNGIPLPTGMPYWTVYPCQPVYLPERYTTANRYTLLNGIPLPTGIPPWTVYPCIPVFPFHPSANNHFENLQNIKTEIGKYSWNCDVVVSSLW